MQGTPVKINKPVVLECTETENGLELLLEITTELACFDGHFPGRPILSGVAQVDWAVRFGKNLGFDPDKFTAIPRLKFQTLIEPDCRVALILRRTNTGLRFAYTSGETLYSQGLIDFSG